MTSKFVWIEVENWQGLYKDGELVLENHSLRPGDIAQEVEGMVYTYEGDENPIDKYLCEYGSFPLDINDLPGVEDGELS